MEEKIKIKAEIILNTQDSVLVREDEEKLISLFQTRMIDAKKEAILELEKKLEEWDPKYEQEPLANVSSFVKTKLNTYNASYTNNSDAFLVKAQVKDALIKKYNEDDSSEAYVKSAVMELLNELELE